MKLQCLLLSLWLLYAGCATYKQLKPDPELSPSEQGYIELKRGDENFELKKGKRYFIIFPAPQQDNFYLALQLPDKKKFTSFFTATLVDQKTYGDKIPDETPYPDTMSVFPIRKGPPEYYWLIHEVPDDMVLKIKYRYVPQWRFKFEVKHAACKEIYRKNIVDRSVYKGIGSSVRLDGFNFVLVMDTVSRHTAELERAYKELLTTESLFPAGLLSSKDIASRNYAELRKSLEEEISFQKNYRRVLEFFYQESLCRNDPLAFVAGVENYIAFFSGKDSLPNNIVQESRTLLGKRLAEVPPFYDARIAAKADALPFDAAALHLKELNRIEALYTAAGMTVPAEYSQQVKFLNDYNSQSTALAAARDSLGQIAQYVRNAPGMPADDFFKPVTVRALALQTVVPWPLEQNYGKYGSVPCATALNQEIAKFQGLLSARVADYQTAEALVPRLNALKAQKNYGSMIAALLPVRNLNFLLEKYKDLDKMSLDAQTQNIQTALENNLWPATEQALKGLHQDDRFLDPAAIKPQASRIVLRLEDSLYGKVERATRSRVNAFLQEKVNTLENVDSLYTDSVFFPVYTISFSSGGKQELVLRQNALVADLARMKSYEFPAKAVKLLYEGFLANPEDNGVLKARAIVTHGGHYLGDDREIKLRIAECNPLLPKLIVKPIDYRRVFVLPVTDNRTGGKNKYLVRLNVNIPTEAMFPVYDVNIKLPREIAQNAASSQWYDKITLNGNPLKNEGRFSITAPSPSNSFECQITPVQMNKDKSNILEITFSHNSFKVYNVSAMVQKPIIKKN